MPPVDGIPTHLVEMAIAGVELPVDGSIFPFVGGFFSVLGVF